MTYRLITNIVLSHRVVIFSKTTCPHCGEIKRIFNRLRTNFKSVELDHHNRAADIQEMLGQITGAKSVPRVFVDGRSVGGAEEVNRMYESGDLLKILNKPRKS